MDKNYNTISNSSEYNNGYNNGMNDFNKIYKKMFPRDFSNIELKEIFGTENIFDIIRNNTIFDISMKIGDYEKNKIKVGDVVKSKGNEKFVVVTRKSEISNSIFIYGIDEDGYSYLSPEVDFEKTQRVIDVSKLLESIKGE